MRLRHQFEHFEPLTGALPDTYAAMFFELVHRARTLLKDRTSEQAKQGAFVLNRIYQGPGFVDPLYQALEQAPIRTKMFGQEIEVIPSSNDVEALYQNMGNIVLTQDQELPDAQWYELFAVLTLSYAEKLCSELHNQATWPPNHFLPEPTDSQINEYAHEYLGLARQAITYAETLKHKRGQKQHAAAKLHEPSNKLKAAVLVLYQEKYISRSNRDAARRILADLIRLEKVKHDEEAHQLYFEGTIALRGDDPEHQFEIWIGQANKAKV